MDVNKLVESRMKSYQDQGDTLRSDWAELKG